MANRYWVGGTATWDGTAGSKWATTSGGAGGAAVPTSADDVFFDSGSGTCTVTTSGTTTDVCNNFTWSSSNVTFSHAAATTVTIHGFMNWTGAGTYTRGNTTTSRLIFAATGTGKTITFNSKAPGDITFDGVGGGWTLQDAPGTNTAPTWTLTNGALDTNNFDLSIGVFASSNSNTRSLTLGTSTITLNAGSGTTWNFATTTNLTFSAASSTIIHLATGSGNAFASGGLTYGTLKFAGGGLGNTKNINGAFTCSALNFGNGGSNPGRFLLDANPTCTGTITYDCTATNNFPSLIVSSSVGTARTLSAGTNTLSNGRWVFRDITAAGAASWDLSGWANGSGDGGGNTGITFTAAANRYYVGNTANFNTANVWATSSGGAGAAAYHPLPQDACIFDANSFSAGGQTVTIANSSCESVIGVPALDFTNVTNNPTFAGANGAIYLGDIIFKSGMSITTTASTFRLLRSSTLDFGGITWPTGAVTIAAAEYTATLTANLAFAAGVTYSTGTVSGAAYTVTCTSTTVSGATVTLLGILGSTTHSYSSGTLTVGASGLTGTALTNSGATFTLNGASTGMTGNMTLSGGSTTLNANYTTTGTLSISNDNTLTINSATLNTSTINIVGGGADTAFSHTWGG